MNLEQINQDIKYLETEFLKFSGIWEYNDGDYGCIDIAREELELCKGIASRYPSFTYNYDPTEFNKNPSDLAEDWSDIKFSIEDYNNNNVNEKNYDKVDAIAFDFKEKLTTALKQLKKEYCPLS